jgi:shikimate dehydrogenase
MYLAIIGDPVDHSKSPQVYCHVFQSLELEVQFQKVKVVRGQISSFINNVQLYDAFLVTMPLKQEILGHLHSACPAVHACQACNFVVQKNGKLNGFNTDGIGALNAIERVLPVAGRSMLVLGAGGCARAICFEAKKRGVRLYIYNRDHEKALQLAKQTSSCALRELGSSYDIIVQATSVGLTEGCFDFKLESSVFASCKVVLEVNYSKRETPFKRVAAGSGAHVIGGDQMYYFMMKEQCRILLNREIKDAIFFEKILHIIGDFIS